MATASFTKEFTISKKEDIERFMDMWCDKTPKPPIDTTETDEALKEGRKLLKQYLSH
jgi:hypothetical protein